MAPDNVYWYHGSLADGSGGSQLALGHLDDVAPQRLPR